MNQISRIFPTYPAEHREADPGGAAVRDALDDAWRHLSLGEHEAARAIGGAMAVKHLPRLNADGRLLAEAVAVLAAADGLLAIARLLRAISGRPVRVVEAAARNRRLPERNPQATDVEVLVLDRSRVAHPAAALEWSRHALAQCGLL